MRGATWMAIVAVCVAASGPAAAEGPCVADARRLCPDVPVGEGRILACFRARWYDVSSACQRVVQDVENRARQINVACSPAVWQYCQGIAPGQGRLLTCVAARWNDLSSTCRDAVGAANEKMQRFQTACAGDAARLCPGVTAGGGKIFGCLKLYEDAVSSACRAAMRP
jgi:hypothetical protein